jgi:hypothetical protein
MLKTYRLMTRSASLLPVFGQEVADFPFRPHGMELAFERLRLADLHLERVASDPCACLVSKFFQGDQRE